jgi:fibro-slime domain-containing protein/MYXO-CTERM domain-containing protein
MMPLFRALALHEASLDHEAVPNGTFAIYSRRSHMNDTIWRGLAVAAGALACMGSAHAATTTLSGTVRDFAADGVNFEGNNIGLITGMVEPTLSGPSPTLTALGKANVDEANFKQWFTQGAPSAPLDLILSEASAGSGLYTYNSNAFFPIDGQLLGNEGRSHNYHFTYAISAQFAYQPGAGQTFTLSGDDDVWVYFDKKLGIDLGGLHSASSASVNLDQLLAGQQAGNYAFDLFYAERHTTESNLSISTSLTMASVPEADAGTLTALGLVVLGAAGYRRRRPG